MTRTRKGPRRSRCCSVLAHHIPRWWELSVNQLIGEMMVRQSWYQYLNRRLLSKIHLILTDEHKSIPILQRPSFLTLVARTGNFIPTPVASQLNSVVHKSLNIFFVRVYNTLSKYVHRKFFNTCDITMRAAGISNWRPKLFPHNSAWQQKIYFQPR